MMNKKFFVVFFVLVSTFTINSNTFAVDISFSWLPNNEPTLAGYRIYYGTASRTYDYVYDVGNPPLTNGRVIANVPGLENGKLYYFAITAYSTDDMESDYSWELTYLTPPADESASYPTWTVYLNNDQIQDTVFVDDDGVYAIYGSENGESTPQLIIPDFSLDGGWTPEKYPLDFYDINKDGVLDFYGIGDHGVRAAYGIDGYSFENSRIIIPEFGYADGWRIEKYPRKFYDINSDGIPDFYGIGDHGVRAAYGIDGYSFENSYIIVYNFGYSDGWLIENSRKFTDVNQDGLPDFSGWKNGEHWVSLSIDGTYLEDAVLWK